MIVRKLRLQRGWSQEQLSEMSGLSVRTIQRIERGDNAGLESLKALASVFEIQVSDLQKSPEPDMTEYVKIPTEEERAIAHVKKIKGFYSHAIWYVLVISGLFIFNYVSEPGYIWAWWPAMGWGSVCFPMHCGCLNRLICLVRIGNANRLKKGWAESFKTNMF